MRKKIILVIVIAVLLIGLLGVTYSYPDDGMFVSFELVGASEVLLELNSEYVEEGVIARLGNKDVSDKVLIDNSSVDTGMIGEYKVKYEVTLNGVSEYIYRVVKVVDRESPEIRLNGGDEVYLLRGNVYFEEGCVVVDNYDYNLDDKVVISGMVETSKVGEYILEYKVSDNSGNEAVKYRKVIVIDGN